MKELSEAAKKEMNEYNKRYHAEHRDEIHEKQRVYREANREKIRERMRIYRAEHPDAVKAAKHRYWEKKAAQKREGE